MINFDKHLRELLYEEDFIIIPGLGAFIASFTQASIKDNGEFVEPFKTFNFNNLLTTDDGNKFINHVLKKENFSKIEIDAQLKAYLFDFRTGLNTNNKLVLADVCTIRKTEEGQLEGYFNREINYYNKPNFSSQDTIPAPVFNEPKVSENINYTSVPISPVQEEILTDYEYQYEEEEESRPWLKYLLYIIPVLFIFGALYYVILYRPFQKADIPVLDTTIVSVPDSIAAYETDSSMLGDSTSQQVVDVIHDGLIEQGSKNIQRFEVSAGLFKNKENANKLVDKMKSAGFDAEIKLVNGMRRVYVPVIGIENAEAMSSRIEQFTGDKSVYFDENGVSNR